MNESEIKCESCGHAFDRSSNRSGVLHACPVCGAALPHTAWAPQERDGLKLRGENLSLSDDHKTCPGCGRLSALDARICTKCGYDWKTGGTRATAYQRKKHWKDVKRPLLFALAALLFLIAALLYLGKDHSPPAAATPPPEDSIAVRAQADFDQWKAAFEQKYPPLQAEQTGEIRLQTGQIIRGKFVLLSRDELTMISENGRQTFSFSDLDPPTRAQVDPSFRSEVIQKEKTKRLSP